METLNGWFELICMGGAEPDTDNEALHYSHAGTVPTGAPRDATLVMRSRHASVSVLETMSTSSESTASTVIEEDETFPPGSFPPPQQVLRNCTDLSCCILWLVAACALVTVVLLGTKKPERHDFIRLTDVRGTQCGVYTEVGKDFWYLCGAEQSDDNDTFLPTCVHECSAAHKNEHCSKEWELMEVSSYEAHQVGPLCWPMNETLAAHLRFVLQARGFKSIDMFLSMYFSWPPLAIAAACAITFSHMWTRILRDHAHCLAWIGLYILVMLPLFWLAFHWLWYGHIERIEAIGCIVCSVSFGLLACRTEKHLDRATSCLHAACHCVTDLPLLELGPAVTTVIKVTMLLFSIWLVRFLPTTVHFEIRTGHLQFLHFGDVAERISDVSVAVLYCIFVLWTWNVINTFWELTIVALTVLWYVDIKKRAEPPDIFRCVQVLGLLLRFHCGTITLAAVLIGFLRPLRFAVGTLTAVTRMPQNPFSWMEMSCCPCVVSCYSMFLDQFSANAFVDLVLHSSPLWPAMNNADLVMQKCQTTANSLNGTTFMFQVICLALTWWFGFVISYVAITQIPEYNDPMRMGYVPYTMAWCFISGFLASGCSFPHLMVFDTSSDTILYLQTLREMQEDEAERENEELAGAFGTTGYLGLLQDIASSAMRCAIP